MNELVPLKGYEGLYSVSRSGKIFSHRVMSTRKKKTRRCTIDTAHLKEMVPNVSQRYVRLTLSDKKGKYQTHYLHRLLCQTFIPNPNNYPIVNHKNGIKHDNRLCNLEWCTHRMNSLHANDIGLIRMNGEDNPSSKLSNAQRIKIVGEVRKGDKSHREIGEKYGVARNTISRINKKWKGVC